jgi:hypothetical protein
MAGKYSNLTGYEKPLDKFTRDELRGIAGNYGIKLSTIISQKLNKSEVISLIQKNPNYKAANPRKNQTLEEKRLSNLKLEIDGLKSPDQIMGKIVNIFEETVSIPEAGNYYTFVYSSKTPNILYDQHPLVAVLSVYDWGFSGINFHWNEVRQYTWQEVVGQLHRVSNKEIEFMKSIAYAKYVHK